LISEKYYFLRLASFTIYNKLITKDDCLSPKGYHSWRETLQIHEKLFADPTELPNGSNSEEAQDGAIHLVGGPQMNKMTPVTNKRPKRPKQVASIRSPHRSCLVGITCLALAIGCFSFIKLATAHSGLEPEIQEITEKLVKDPDNVDLLVRRGQVYRSNG